MYPESVHLSVVMEKTVLVIVGHNKRLVSFSSTSDASDVESLKSAVLVVFRDVLAGVDSQDLMIQIKNNDWGEFIDHMGNEDIETKSIVTAQLIPKPEVSVYVQVLST